MHSSDPFEKGLTHLELVREDTFGRTDNNGTFGMVTMSIELADYKEGHNIFYSDDSSPAQVIMRSDVNSEKYQAASD